MTSTLDTIEPTLRTFYRCYACLSIVAVDGDEAADEMRRHEVACVCGNTYWHDMGRVRQSRLIHDDAVPPCDGRCTDAAGPNCNCGCGGVNHGSHKSVRIVRDAGAVPHIDTPNAAACIARATEWREATAQAEARILKMPHAAQVIAGEWVDDKAAWQAVIDARTAWRKARDAGTHKGRMEKLAKVAEGRES